MAVFRFQFDFVNAEQIFAVFCEDIFGFSNFQHNLKICKSLSSLKLSWYERNQVFSFLIIVLAARSLVKINIFYCLFLQGYHWNVFFFFAPPTPNVFAIEFHDKSLSGGIQLCHLLLAGSITNLLLQITLLLWLINRVFCRYILAVHKTMYTTRNWHIHLLNLIDQNC